MMTHFIWKCRIIITRKNKERELGNGNGKEIVLIAEDCNYYKENEGFSLRF